MWHWNSAADFEVHYGLVWHTNRLWRWTIEEGGRKPAPERYATVQLCTSWKSTVRHQFVELFQGLTVKVNLSYGQSYLQFGACMYDKYMLYAKVLDRSKHTYTRNKRPPHRMITICMLIATRDAGYPQLHRLQFRSWWRLVSQPEQIRSRLLLVAYLDTANAGSG